MDDTRAEYAFQPWSLQHSESTATLLMVWDRDTWIVGLMLITCEIQFLPGDSVLIH